MLGTQSRYRWTRPPNFLSVCQRRQDSIVFVLFQPARVVGSQVTGSFLSVGLQKALLLFHGAPLVFSVNQSAESTTAATTTTATQLARSHTTPPGGRGLQQVPPPPHTHSASLTVIVFPVR